MARKAPALPDVFARPGAAPSRGTAIEDLPQPDPELMTREPEPAVEPAPPAVSEPEPPPPAPPAAAAPPLPAIEEFYQPAFEPRRAKPSGGNRALTLAVVALLVSLSAPFWEDPLLSVLGLHTPLGRAADRGTLAVMQQDRRTEDIAQRLSAATALMIRQQADFASAMQRADRAATLIRTMALVRLSDTLRRPMPFAAELAVVRASGTDLGDLQPLLDQIEPYAGTGIPGATQLRQDFRTLYEPIARSDGGAAPASWMGNLAAWTHLRSAAPTQPTGDPSLELLQTASARLADVDVAGALEATRQVSDSYRAAFANWVEDAQARVAADTLAERASDMVTQALRPAPAVK